MKQFLLFTFICTLLFGFTIKAFAAGPLGGGAETSCNDKGCTITNPLGSQTMKPADLIGKIINGVLGVVGSLALLMFIYGGFTWMTAAGASDKVQHGKDILIWATIGLVVIFSAYAMVRFVFTDILGGA